jgi:hypothetical protein
MSILVSASSADFSTSGTFQLVDPTSWTPPSLTGTVTAVQKLSTFSNTGLGTFTLASAITVDAIGVYLDHVAASTGDTLTIYLYDVTATTALCGAQITLNDIVSNGANDSNAGWHVAQIQTGPFTTVAGHVYEIWMITTNANSAFTRATTGGKQAYFLRTTTAQIPTSGDTLIVAGLYPTSPGNVTAINVTYGNNDTTNAYAGFWLGNGGSLSFDTVASSTYYLKIATGGFIYLGVNSSFNIGTTGTRMPKTSTATLFFNSTATTCLIENYGGTFSVVGDNTRLWSTILSATSANGQAVLNCTAVTGWANGDTLVISPSYDVTAANYSHTDTKIISSITGNAVTLTTNLAYTRNYSATYNCEIANVTRNVTINGSTDGWQYFGNTNSTTLLDSALLSNLQGSATGINIWGLGVGTHTITDCVQTTSPNHGGIFLGNGATTSTQTINLTNHIIYGITDLVVTVSANAGAGVTVNGLMYTASGGNTNSPIIISSIAATVTNLYISSISSSIAVNLSGIFTGTLSNWYIHGCDAADAISVSSSSVTISYVTITQALVALQVTTASQNHIFNNLNFLNVVTGVEFSTSSNFSGIVTFNNSIFAGCTNGVLIDNAIIIILQFNACTFTSNTHDFTCSTAGTNPSITLNDCVWSATVVTTNWNTFGNPAIYDPQPLGTSSATYFKYGIILEDQYIYRSSSTSMRITPNTLGTKVQSSIFSVPVTGGVSSTVSIWIRRSVSTDIGGANYNGGQPNLYLVANDQLGITTNTIQQTGSAAVGTWEQLSATVSSTNNTVAQFYIDCDGSAGWINVDDFAATTSYVDTTSFNFWIGAQPFIAYGSGSVIDIESLSDTLTFSQSLSYVLDIPFSLYQTLTFTQALSQNHKWAIPYTDTLTFSQSTSYTHTRSYLLSQTLIFSDLVTSVHVTPIPISQSLIFSEILDVSHAFLINYSDPLTFIDDVTFNYVNAITLFDTISFMQSTSASSNSLFQTSQNLSFLESLSYSEIHSKSIFDTLNLSQSLTSVHINFITCNDTLSLSQNLTYLYTVSRHVPDTLSLVSITNENFSKKAHQSIDSIIYNSAPYSYRITPSILGTKIQSTTFNIPISSEIPTTVSVWVRKSINTDPSGANYNGGQPNLYLAANGFLGSSVDTIQSTMSVGFGIWQKLSVTVLSTYNTVAVFYIDCDGSSGWINIDDINISTENVDTTNFDYWSNGLPFINYGNIGALDTETLPDVLTFVSSVTVQHVRFIDLLQSLVFVEIVSTNHSAFITYTDTINFNQIANVIHASFINLSQNLTFSENVIHRVTYVFSITIPFSETLALSKNQFINVNQTVNFIDIPSENAILNITINDTDLEFAELLVKSHINVVSINDTLSFTDGSLYTKTKILKDIVVLSENLILTKNQSFIINDPITFGENLTKANRHNAILTNNLVFNQVLNLQRVHYATLLDEILLTQTVYKEGITTLFDFINFNSNVSYIRKRNLLLTFTDTLNINDFVSLPNTKRNLILNDTLNFNISTYPKTLLDGSILNFPVAYVVIIPFENFYNGSVQLSSKNALIILPSPNFNNVKASRSKVTTKRTMGGALYAYTQQNLSRKLVYTFSLGRQKIEELRTFVAATHTDNIQITDWAGQVWIGKLINTPGIATDFKKWTYFENGRLDVSLEFDALQITG